MQEEEFYAWINPAYLDPSTQGDIQESFGDKSEIQLQEFLHPSKYAALCQALRLPEVTWTQVGPANKRHYQVASDASAIVGQARNFFQSEAFFLVLSSLTGLKLHQLAPTPSSSENESDADEGNGSKSSRSKPKPSAIDPCCKIQVGHSFAIQPFHQLSDIFRTKKMLIIIYHPVRQPVIPSFTIKTALSTEADILFRTLINNQIELSET